MNGAKQSSAFGFVISLRTMQKSKEVRVIRRRAQTIQMLQKGKKEIVRRKEKKREMGQREEEEETVCFSRSVFVRLCFPSFPSMMFPSLPLSFSSLPFPSFPSLLFLPSPHCTSLSFSSLPRFPFLILFLSDLDTSCFHTCSAA